MNNRFVSIEIGKFSVGLVGEVLGNGRKRFMWDLFF